eukprot:CAMPEP_0172671138 /NCGR_PEP_ID=MMETSP1074-20121228/10731_1 /TAXON_ID=2916 /ORGANISM="Ceratium fusus, Strain PA161109" /LENGTH=192 /DNA_ID=CAMNT_0013488139 /DNA_START=50 /DNA_END=628 /DNA_ORIENTATION=-
MDKGAIFGSMVPDAFVQDREINRKAAATIRAELSGWDPLMQGLRQAHQLADNIRHPGRQRKTAEAVFICQCGKVNHVLEVALKRKNVKAFVKQSEKHYAADLKKVVQLIDNLELLETFQSDQRVTNCRSHCEAALTLLVQFADKQVDKSHANRIPKKHHHIEDDKSDAFTNSNVHDELHDEFITFPQAMCCW